VSQKGEGSVVVWEEKQYISRPVTKAKFLNAIPPFPLQIWCRKVGWRLCQRRLESEVPKGSSQATNDGHFII
jgi:hypothetical protein